MKQNLDAPISSKEVAREICKVVHELSNQVAAASINAAGPNAQTHPSMALWTLRLNLAHLGESVTRLRWLSMALVSAQLEIVESSLDLSALVEEAMSRVQPPLPDACECTYTGVSGIIVHADLALLVQGLALLLNAASLRLGNGHGSSAHPQLKLRVRAKAGKAVLCLAYNAPHRGPPEADGHEKLALKVLRSIGASASVLGTKRWSVIHLRLPRDAAPANARDRGSLEEE